jgi:hypothetical protein
MRGIVGQAHLRDGYTVLLIESNQMRVLFEHIAQQSHFLRDDNHQRKLGVAIARHKTEVLRFDCVWNPATIGDQGQTWTARSDPGQTLASSWRRQCGP